MALNKHVFVVLLFLILVHTIKARDVSAYRTTVPQECLTGFAKAQDKTFAAGAPNLGGLGSRHLQRFAQQNQP